MTKAPTHVVEVTDKRARRSHARQCVLGEDVRFDKAALEAAVSAKLEDVDVDLLVVIASVAYVDRAISRRRGTRWGRELSVVIPVYHPERWEHVRSDLVRLLRSLTGDVWHIEFVPRAKRDEMTQQFLPGLSRGDFQGATIIPYSGGLDSFATLARLRQEKPDGPVLLVNARRSIRNEVLAKPIGEAVVGIPYRFKELRHAEESYRTRTFVYFALAALVWRLNAGERVWIGESGIGCIGPTLVPFGIEQPVRGSHPAFLGGLSSFLGALWGTPPAFHFPHLWCTKGEVLADLFQAAALSGWEATRSCSRAHRRQHPWAAGSHCGLCTGCLFRRVSLLSAGIAVEQPGTYFEDVLCNTALSDHLKASDREVAICAVIAMDELASCAARLDVKRVEIAELASAMRQPESTTTANLQRLLVKHRDEWARFLIEVPANSWIRAVCTSTMYEAA
jgi:hypothetical protein